MKRLYLHSYRPLFEVKWFTRIGVVLGFLALTTGVQLLCWEWIEPAPYLLFYLTIFPASYVGGRWLGIFFVICTIILAEYFFIPPYHHFLFLPKDCVRHLLFAISSLIIVEIIQSLRRAFRDMKISNDWLFTTLNGIGDAVIATDDKGNISFMNPMAETLTQCRLSQAEGQPIEQVFNIVNQETRKKASNPVQRVLTEGIVVGLANHTQLIGKLGVEYSIEDSAAPIRDERGTLYGVVMVFRDITEKYLAAKKIQESESHFRQMADLMPQIVWTARTDGFLDYYNQRWYEFTGIPTGTTESQSWLRLLHNDDREKCESEWTRSISKGQEFHLEFRLWDKNANIFRWHLGRALPIRDEFGKIIKWFGTSTDIHETKNLSEKRRYLSELTTCLSESLDFEKTLESVAEQVVSHMGSWCFLHAIQDENVVSSITAASTDPKIKQSLLKFAGLLKDLSSENAVAQTIKSRMPQLRNHLTDEYYEKMAVNEEHLLLFKELHPRSVLVVPLLSRGKLLGTLTVAISSDDRSYTDSDLQFMQEIADRAAVAIENAQLYQEAKSALRVRDEFLSICSHELKTPITSLKLQVQLICRKMQKQTENPQNLVLQKFLVTSNRQLDRLTRLIEDMLDVSRVALDKFSIHPEKTNLTLLMSEVLDRFSEEFISSQTQLDLSLQDHLTIECDPYRIEQAVTNLMANTLKYAHGKPVKVSLNQQEESIEITIEDHGIGIAEESIDRVFLPFERAISATNISGMGLGLYITKKIIDAHHGQINVKSELGRGSKFSISLPFIQPVSDLNSLDTQLRVS